MRVSDEIFNKMSPELQRLFVKVDNPLKDEVLALFPETKSTIGKTRGGGRSSGIMGKKVERSDKDEPFGYTDSGSAARFFYCSKASRAERNMGLDEVNNHHVCVKPVKLMQYLVTLVTREGQIVLDPFMGSGTTGMACKLLSRRFIGCELDADYFEIARRRIDAIEAQMQLRLGI